MGFIAVQRHERGLRIYLADGRVRVHHGAIGAVLIALGSMLCGHDFRDRWWLHD